MSQKITEDRFTLEEMVSELEEFAECAGFEDYYNRVLKDLDEDQIRKVFHETFFESNDPEEEGWCEGWFEGRY